MKTFKAGMIEVMADDINQIKPFWGSTYRSALEEIKNIGEGWRLPNKIEEIEYLISLSKMGIGGFNDQNKEYKYWTSIPEFGSGSDEYGIPNVVYVVSFCKKGPILLKEETLPIYKNGIRLVRDI